MQLVLAALLLAVLPHLSRAAGSTLLFRNASAPLEARLEDLVSRLTPAELFAQLAGPEVGAIPRLNISRHAFMGECLAGLGSVNISTSWPMPVALAASFDAVLAANVSSAMASEARGHHNAFGTWSAGSGGDLPPYGHGWDSTCLVPQLNVYRDPRWCVATCTERIRRGIIGSGAACHLTSNGGVAGAGTTRRSAKARWSSRVSARQSFVGCKAVTPKRRARQRQPVASQ
jgi:hypothetical protein